MKKILILGGGTFNHVRNHFSLAAPAFGKVAKQLHKKLAKYGSELILTKMADSNSKIITNQDLSDFIDNAILDPSVGTIIMSCAVCDFDAQIDGVTSSALAERLKSSEGSKNIILTPSEKIIKKIRVKRPDIFLVGFKTTTNSLAANQYFTALNFMKDTKCNLVLANDLVTRINMVVTPEEAYYYNSTYRDHSIKGLVSMIINRHDLTYNRTKLITTSNVQAKELPTSLFLILHSLINKGAFISDNGHGFTPGHFCYKQDENTILSSQRKVDHNQVLSKGLTKVVFQDGSIKAYGLKKPSVGATSQKVILDAYPEYDCIIHTHNPKKTLSKLHTVAQENFQCGSLECGENTLKGLRDCSVGKAVFLHKHGLVLLFKRSEDPDKVVKFIEDNIILGSKIK